jgi:hypothetical protein
MFLLETEEHQLNEVVIVPKSVNRHRKAAQDRRKLLKLDDVRRGRRRLKLVAPRLNVLYYKPLLCMNHLDFESVYTACLELVIKTATCAPVQSVV